MISGGRVHAAGKQDGFVGRERDLAELRRLAGGARAVALCGEGGIGKTWLLRRLMDDLAPDYPGGTFIVGLADLRQPDLLTARVASAIGVAEEPGIPLPDSLAVALSGRRLVLALDDCDHLADACAGLCQQLLARAPGLLVITTTQAAGPVADAAEWAVPPLELPAAGVADPEQALGCAAVRLFAVRAAAAAPGFALDPGNCAAVAEICRALGGLPLAIELAAAWAGVLTAGQIAASLADRSGLAAGGDRGTVRAMIGWSHDRLRPDEQILLRRLSVFAGWSLEMAERVCSDDRVPAARIGALLAGLAGTALIRQESDLAGQSRFRMLNTVRDCAAGWLEQAGETTPVRRRLRDYAIPVGEYFLSIMMAQVPAHWSVRIQLFERYRVDADNIRAVLDWCLEQGDVESGLRLSASFGGCWLALGDSAEGVRWVRAFLAGDLSAVPDSARGPALSSAAYLILGTDLEQARSWAAEALEACQAAGNHLFFSASLSLLSQAALRSGQVSDAVRYAAEAVANARRHDDRWSEGYGLSVGAEAQAMAGNLAEARKLAEAGVEVLLGIDMRWGAAATMIGLAAISRALGELDAARGHYEAALALLVRGDPQTARCLAGLGRVALEQGDLDTARTYLAQGLKVSLRSGSSSGISRGLLAFARLAIAEGQPDRSVQLAAAVTALGPAAGPGPESADGAQQSRHQVQRYLDAAAGLGPAQVDRLWAAGLKLSAAAAAELAVGPPEAG
jgi:predicted ATPase